MLRNASTRQQTHTGLDARCARLLTLVGVLCAIGLLIQLANGTALATSLLGALLPVAIVGALWVAGRAVSSWHCGASLPRH